MAFALVCCSVGSVLLVVSGIVKLRDPVAAEATISRLTRRPSHRMGRPLGVAEILVGTSALVAPNPVTASLVAFSYGAFALVAARLLRDAHPARCGCFGTRSAPVRPVHVVVDVVLACGAAALAVLGATRPPLDTLPTAGIVPIVLVGVATYLVVAMLTVLVDVLGALDVGQEQRR